LEWIRNEDSGHRARTTKTSRLLVSRSVRRTCLGYERFVGQASTNQIRMAFGGEHELMELTAHAAFRGTVVEVS
jgi:hypothetical protein